MSFHKKTVRDIDLNGKRVLVRVDYNVPVNDKGEITDDYRIEKSLPTIQYLLEQNSKVILCAHLGRPKDKHDKHCSLRPCADQLGKLLDRPIKFSSDCVGDEAEWLANELTGGEILLLENLRFHKEEEENDDEFAKRLANLGDVFVQDGFGIVHRAHASTDAVTRHLPSVAGLLLEKEVDAITNVIENPERPLMAIVGGAKISDKIDILNRLIDVADVVAVGGAMANTFLLAQDIKIGKSLAEKEDLPLAREIIEKAREKSRKQKFVFYLPQDGVVSSDREGKKATRIVDWDAHVIAEIESYPKKPERETGEVLEDEQILDIGPFSGSFIAGAMQLANTVIWNGTMGVTEVKGLKGPTGPFAHGTEIIVDAMLGGYGNRPFTLVGGGDTAGYVESQGMTKNFGHVSTGGGASMELLSGKKLPGVEALQDK